MFNVHPRYDSNYPQSREYRDFINKVGRDFMSEV